jgi:hypothetical protein
MRLLRALTGFARWGREILYPESLSANHIQKGTLSVLLLRR